MAGRGITDPSAETHSVRTQNNSLSTEVCDLSKVQINTSNIDIIPLESTVLNIDTTDKRTRRVIKGEYTFAAKKTVAQGMMDVALITANANQLRYLVEYQRHSPTFYVIVFLIVFSLLLQIAVGVSLIFKGRFDLRGKSKSPEARKINNYMVVGIFLISIINVFIAAFSVGGTSSTIIPLNSQTNNS